MLIEMVLTLLLPVLLAVFLSLVAHAMIAFTFWNPFVAMVMFGYIAVISQLL